MKRIIILILSVFIGTGTISCKKNEEVAPTDNTTTDSGTENNDGVSWRIDFQGAIYSDVVLDENDNLYFLASENAGDYLYAYDKDGKAKWKSPITVPTYTESHLFYAENKIVVGIKQTLQCFDLTGKELWQVNLPAECSDIAYANGYIYSVGTDYIQAQSVLTAFDMSGSQIWNAAYNEYYEPAVSAIGNNVCLTLENRGVVPNKLVIKLLKNSGTSYSTSWEHSFDRDLNVIAYANSASFDKDNVYFEESAMATSYIHSYKISDGSENWSVKLSDYPLERYTILTGNGKVIATYRSTDFASEINSFKVIDANTGAITATQENIINNTRQMFLTSSGNIITFDADKIREFSMQGNSIADYDYSLIDNMNFFNYCITNSKNSLIAIDGGSVVCAKPNNNFTLAGTGSWNCKNGNVFHTKTLY